MARAMIVVYMDRARGHTVCIFAQNLHMTRTTPAKLRYFVTLHTLDFSVFDQDRTTNTTTRALSLLWQLAHDQSSAAQSKDCTVKGIEAHERCSRTCSRERCAGSICGTVSRSRYRLPRPLHEHAHEPYDRLERPTTKDFICRAKSPHSAARTVARATPRRQTCSVQACRARVRVRSCQVVDH